MMYEIYPITLLSAHIIRYKVNIIKAVGINYQLPFPKLTLNLNRKFQQLHVALNGYK